MVTKYTFKKTGDGKIVPVDEPDSKALARKKRDDVKTLRTEKRQNSRVGRAGKVGPDVYR